jgi:hypothetical protein
MFSDLSTLKERAGLKYPIWCDRYRYLKENYLFWGKVIAITRSFPFS